MLTKNTSRILGAALLLLLLISQTSCSRPQSPDSDADLSRPPMSSDQTESTNIQDEISIDTNISDGLGDETEEDDTVSSPSPASEASLPERTQDEIMALVDNETPWGQLITCTYPEEKLLTDSLFYTIASLDARSKVECLRQSSRNDEYYYVIFRTDEGGVFIHLFEMKNAVLQTLTTPYWYFILDKPLFQSSFDSIVPGESTWLDVKEVDEYGDNLSFYTNRVDVFSTHQLVDGSNVTITYDIDVPKEQYDVGDYLVAGVRFVTKENLRYSEYSVYMNLQPVDIEMIKSIAEMARKS